MHWYRPKLTAEEGSLESQGSSCPLITFLITRPNKKKLGIPLLPGARDLQLKFPDKLVAEIPTEFSLARNFPQMESTP